MDKTKPIKPFFVVNPTSAAGKTRRRFEDALKIVKPEFPNLDFAYTKGPMDAAELTARALADHYDVIIACGGDGTNNEVLNGFLNREGRPRFHYAALGFYPSGTGGDFRRNLELPSNPQELLTYLKKGERRSIDVGELEFINVKGEHDKRFFLNILSFGIGGLVDHYVNSMPKILGGKASFFMGSVRAMFKYRNQPIRLVMDGSPAYNGPVKLVAIANGSYFGGGMMVAPDARIDDGMFDVVVFKDLSMAEFARLSGSIYSGTHVDHPGIDVSRARVVSAVGPQPLLLDMDGEEAGSTPIKARCLPGAITILQMPDTGMLKV